MDLKVSDEQLQQIITAAIVSQLTNGSKELLFAEAVKSLMTVERDKYYGGNTPAKTRIQKSVDEAISHLAMKYAAELLERDENIKEQIRQLFIDAVAKFFGSDNRQKVIDAFCAAMAKGINGY